MVGANVTAHIAIHDLPRVFGADARGTAIAEGLRSAVPRLDEVVVFHRGVLAIVDEAHLADLRHCEPMVLPVAEPMGMDRARHQDHAHGFPIRVSAFFELHSATQATAGKDVQAAGYDARAEAEADKRHWRFGRHLIDEPRQLTTRGAGASGLLASIAQ